MAFRLGYRFGEWEHLQPVEVWAMWDAAMWRRNRDLEAMTRIGVRIMNRIPWNESPVDETRLLDSLPLYAESNVLDDPGADDAA